MSTRAMARLALLACVMAFMPASAHANEGAHAVAERFAEPERSEAAKAEDARKREAELKADKERQEAAARRAAEALKADKEKAEKARRAKARTPEAVRPTAERSQADEAEMLARAKREAEEMQAAEEARILAEQAAAMQRARSELEASQAAEQQRAKADAQRREAARSKDAGIARAEAERAKLEELAREAAHAQQAEAAARLAEERAKAEASAREAERVKQAEAAARATEERAKAEVLAREAAERVKQAEAAARAVEERAKAEALVREAEERVRQAEAESQTKAEAAARAEADRLAKVEAERLAQAEADRLSVEWTKRAVANRQAMQKLGRMRDIREARLAAQAQRAEAERKVAEARRKAEDEQRAAAPENRRPELAEAPRPERVERTEGSARETAGKGEIDLSELRLPKLGGPEPDRSEPRTAGAQERASRDIDLPDLRVDRGIPGERTVTVLLVMAPGNYGIRRNGPKVADPILCTVAGCYVSTGPGTPARFLPDRKATGVGNTIGGRAGACRQSLGCIFRGIDIDERLGYLQPVDLHIFKHDRRRPQLIERDSDCRVADGRLSCRRGIYAEDYAMWVIPERMAADVGLGVLQRALDEGLAAPRSADLQPRR